MSKKLEEVLAECDDEIFEIIELAIDDIDLLTRAFDVIEQVCGELECEDLQIDILPEKDFIH